METIKENEFLDFLAESFLQQGASISFTQIGGASALKVISEDEHARVFIAPEEEASKMKFLKENISEEIIIPVLRSQEEFRYRSVLKRAGISTVKVERLSLPERFAWYSRKLSYIV